MSLYLLLYRFERYKYWRSSRYRYRFLLAGKEWHCVRFGTYFLYAKECRLNSHTFCVQILRVRISTQKFNIESYPMQPFLGTHVC